MKIIDVKCKAIREKTGQWTLIIKCPFCGKIHTHGGGKSDKPEMGARQPHCPIYSSDQYNITL
jgi:hypothetical protein